MDTNAALEQLQALILKRIATAAEKRDFSGVAHLSGLAKECQALEVEFGSLSRRLTAVRSAVNGSADEVPESGLAHDADLSRGPSAKAAGAQARQRWIAGLRQRGVSLSGHGKRYGSPLGGSVAVAFANELPRLKNRWFLGLTDEPTDIAVLLCQSLAGKLYDLVLPVKDLKALWRVLSRHGGQIKFNVRKDASHFLLLVPGNEPLDVTRYLGDYGILGNAAA